MTGAHERRPCPLEEWGFDPRVDYLGGWREAAEAAGELNAALDRAGLLGGVVRAVPHAGASGEPVIWLRVEAARVITSELGHGRGDGEGGHAS